MAEREVELIVRFEIPEDRVSEFEADGQGKSWSWFMERWEMFYEGMWTNVGQDAEVVEQAHLEGLEAMNGGNYPSGSDY